MGGWELPAPPTSRVCGSVQALLLTGLMCGDVSFRVNVPFFLSSEAPVIFAQFAQRHRLWDAGYRSKTVLTTFEDVQRYSFLTS